MLIDKEWIKKMCDIPTMEYYSAIKKNEITLFAAIRMDLETVILNEVSQRRNIVMTSLIHGICKEMIQMILLKSRKILIASENKFMVAGRKDGRKG